MPEMIQRSSFTSAHSLTAGATSPRLTSILPNENDDPHIPDSIPPWVHLTTDNHTSIPEPIRPNTRHWKPPPPANYRPGKKWDHLRSAEPPLLSLPIEERQIAWKPFMGSGPNMRYEADTENARLMSSGWVEENMPVTQRQWEKHDEMAVDKSEDADGYWFLWFLSPERRDRTTRVFWVSFNFSLPMLSIANQTPAPSPKKSFYSSNISSHRSVLFGSSAGYSSDNLPGCTRSKYRCRPIQQLCNKSLNIHSTCGGLCRCTLHWLCDLG